MCKIPSGRHHDGMVINGYGVEIGEYGDDGLMCLVILEF